MAISEIEYNTIVASMYLLPYAVSPRVLIPSSNLASAFEGGDRQGEETIFFCALSLHNTVQAGAVRWTAAMNQGAASLLVTVRT